MTNAPNSREPEGNPPAPDQDVQRPSFVSEDVWRVVEIAAAQNDVQMKDYIEKALLDEAVILEQLRFGRKWLVRNEMGDVGEVRFS